TRDRLESGYTFEARLDSVNGRTIGEGRYLQDPGANGDGPSFQPLTITLDSVDDGRQHDLYIVSRPDNPGAAGTLIVTTIRFNPTR
ncbi:MAG: hypothetical protein R3224_10995, partial [Balneolaceae bacterium]|nr:hypothetical protein [Balneolaceae bacterium]